MPRLSISYRRADTAPITGRIFDRLNQYYGENSVFRDIDNIPAGVDFRKHVSAALGKSDVLLAIVGEQWLSASKDGQSRLHNEKDHVRIEVETALQRNIPIIPVLIGNATMPDAQQLPPSLQDFAYYNGVRVDPEKDFNHHIRPPDS